MALKRINTFSPGMTDNVRDKRDGAALEIAEFDIYKAKDFMTTGTRSARVTLSYNVTLTRSGTTVTATTSIAHRLQVGQTVIVSGADQAAYNGTYIITSTPTTTTFTYTIVGSPATPATGSIKAKAEFLNRHIVGFATGDDSEATLYVLAVDDPKDATFFKLPNAHLGNVPFELFTQKPSDAALYNTLAHHRYYQNVVKLTQSGGVATLLTDGSSDIATGDQIVVSGVQELDYNGTFTVTTGSGVTYTSTGANGIKFVQSSASDKSISESTPARITRTSGSFVAEGYVEDMWIKVSGSHNGTNDTPAGYALKVGAVTATQLTIVAGPAITTDSTSVNTATITVNNAIKYSVPGATPSPATVSEDVTRVSAAHLYYVVHGYSATSGKTYSLAKIGALPGLTTRKVTDRTGKEMVLNGFSATDSVSDTPGGPFPNIRLQGIQLFGNGQYVATVDGTGAYNPAAFTLPNGWICQSFAPFNYSVAILAKSTVKAESHCTVFFWDLVSPVQPYAEAYVPAAEPTVIFNQQGALYVVTVERNGITRIYQLTDTGYAQQTHRFSDTNTYQFGATGKSITTSILDTSKITQNNKGLFGISRDSSLDSPVEKPGYVSGGLMAFGPPQGSTGNAVSLLYGAMTETVAPTSIISSGTTATVTLPSSNLIPLYNGLRVEIYGANNDTYNTDFNVTPTGTPITVTSPTTFTYTLPQAVVISPATDTATGNIRIALPQFRLGVSAAVVSGPYVYTGVYSGAPIVGIGTTTEVLDGVCIVDQNKSTGASIFRSVNIDNNLPEIPKEWNRVTLVTDTLPDNSVVTLKIFSDKDPDANTLAEYQLTSQNAQNTFSGDQITFWERDLNIVSRSVTVALMFDLPADAAPVNIYSLTLQYNNVVTIS